MERRPTTTVLTDVVGCSQLMVNAGVVLVTSSPAFAHHNTVGDGTAFGGSALIGAILPIIVGVVLVMVGVGIWGPEETKDEVDAQETEELTSPPQRSSRNC